MNQLSGFNLTELAALLPQHVQVYVVGGAVRDQLMGVHSADRDWVVVGATVDDMQRAGFTAVGADFPVFLHPQTHEEFALARTERKQGKGYKGFTFFADPAVTLEQDLQRRDLTLNAMAMTSTGQLIDPYGGLADLNAKVLRHVSPAFVEDPLRVLRLARFLARYEGFSVAPETVELCQEIVRRQEMQHLVAERVFTELNKTMSAVCPSKAWAFLAQLHVWAELLPNRATAWEAMPPPVSQTMDLTLTHPLMRWAWWLSRVNNPENILSTCACLRTPLEVKEHAMLWFYLDQFAVDLQTQQDIESACAHLLTQVDVYRKPNRFEQLLNAWYSVQTPSDRQAVQQRLNPLVHSVLSGEFKKGLRQFFQDNPSVPASQAAQSYRQLWLKRQLN